MKPVSTIQFAMLTDTGQRRARNEDACAADDAVRAFVVCDGMGGAAAGDVASSTAARVFLEYLRSQALTSRTMHAGVRKAIAAANMAVYTQGCASPRQRGMGTTLVALQVEEDGSRVWVANVGDSRCYRLRAGRLERLTEDHSLVEEQVRLGGMTADEAARSPLRNVITRAVGSHREVDADIRVHANEPGDLYLLCSDGLMKHVDDQELLVFLRSQQDLDALAHTLVDAANQRGGEDNITVLLVRIDTVS